VNVITGRFAVVRKDVPVSLDHSSSNNVARFQLLHPQRPAARQKWSINVAISANSWQHLAITSMEH